MAYYFSYVPILIAAEPATGECTVGCWWIVHPEKGLAFYRRSSDPHYIASQCNRDKKVTEDLQPKLHPECEVVHLPLVFMTSVRRWLKENSE
jgi:hypothetical protein